MIATLLLSSLLAAAPPGAAFQPKSRPYDAQHYALELRLDDEGAFKNKLTATLKPTRPFSELEFDVYDLKIEMVLVDGAAADFKLKLDAGLRQGVMAIKVPKAALPGKDVKVEISYSGQAGTEHMGLFKVTSDDPAALPYYFTHFETTSAQRFFPCNDQPSDKATFELTAIVDGRYTVISNGVKDKDEAFSESGKNLRRFHFAQTQPIAPYTFAIAVGQYEAVESSPDIPATVWVRPGTKDRAFVAADSLRDIVRAQAAFLGVKYPWAKADLVAVPHYFWSGMENTGLIFAREPFVVLGHKNDMLSRQEISSLLSHEIAHQWFGDDVTLKWWDDTWLNEGFATWFGSVVLDQMEETDEMEVRSVVRLTSNYARLESGPRSHALVGKSGSTPEDMFDAISYTKGAMVLRMLDGWIGREDMKKSLKAYLEKSAFGNATSDDFFKAVYDVTKKQRELAGFHDSWLNKKGYPVIFPEATFEGGKLKVTIRQQPSRSDEKGPFVFKLPIVIHRQNEPTFKQEATILVDKPVVTVTLDVPSAPQWINWNQNNVALVKVDGPAVAEAQWIDAARYDPDSAWRTTAAFTLLGEIAALEPKSEALPTPSALNAVIDLLQKDPSPYVREAVLERMANTRLKQLPKDFEAVGLALARKPEGLTEDPLGYIRVRRAATQMLARTDSADGHAYILEQLSKRDVDLNYLGAFAAATARINSASALTALRAALPVQRARGYVYYRRTVDALGAVPNTDVLPIIREVLTQEGGNNEIARAIFTELRHNRSVRETPEFSELIRDVVVNEKVWGEDLRSEALRFLDDVKNPAAREALKAIIEKSSSERLKADAKATVAANFPAAPAPKKK